MGKFSVVYAACATRTRAGFMVLRQRCFANLENCARFLPGSVATCVTHTNLQLAFSKRDRKDPDTMRKIENRELNIRNYKSEANNAIFLTLIFY